MGRYIRKRLLQAVPVVFGITILTFFIMKTGKFWLQYL